MKINRIDGFNIGDVVEIGKYKDSESEIKKEFIAYEAKILSRNKKVSSFCIIFVVISKAEIALIYNERFCSKIKVDKINRNDFYVAREDENEIFYTNNRKWASFCVFCTSPNNESEIYRGYTTVINLLK